ncbi:MAG: hypothetical protein AMXMBFR22_28370 [Phycisphaerae bacterium]
MNKIMRYRRHPKFERMSLPLSRRKQKTLKSRGGRAATGPTAPRLPFLDAQTNLYGQVPEKMAVAPSATQMDPPR